MNLRDVVTGAVGPYPDNCGGYLNRDASGLGYIASLKLSLGCVDKEGFDEGLARIIAYDRASKNDSYFGQVNMVAASSFCGVNGAIWGLDLARAVDLHTAPTPIATLTRHDGAAVPVLSIDPLLDAGMRLFGSDAQRRFNILPGEVVVAASKGTVAEGPTTIWGSLGLATAEDRDRDAHLFVEDASDTTTGGEQPVDPLVVARSILAVGKNQHVNYSQIFVGVKSLAIPDGYIGTALAAAPYVTLATNAIPKGSTPADLIDMTVAEWERRLDLPPLRVPPPATCAPASTPLPVHAVGPHRETD